MNTNKVDKIFDKMIDNKRIHEGVLIIEDASGAYSYCREYNRSIDSPMLTASIGKMYTTACIMSMLQERHIQLEDKITKFFSQEDLSGLHIYKQQEYSQEISIKHLLYQTSGLPDYYEKSKETGVASLIKQDFSFTFEQELGWTKQMDARFAPGTKNKAYYADINFDLLGKIIEQVTKLPLSQAYQQFVFEPLGLEKTYLASSQIQEIPHTYYKLKKLERPKFIASSFASGGCVTTARELMLFQKGFWQGRLFEQSMLEKMSNPHPLQIQFYPIGYDSGYMRINVSYPFGKKHTVVGHSGSTGSFAFYYPQRDLFFAGDIPQICYPNYGTQLLFKSVLAI